MRLIQIRAPRDEDADCLVRELAVYNPRRARREVLIELDDSSPSSLLALLTAVETCLSTNNIRSVLVELDGQRYTLALH